MNDGHNINTTTGRHWREAAEGAVTLQGRELYQRRPHFKNKILTFFIYF